MMDLRLDRTPTEKETTFGQLFFPEGVFCQTLEDALRDHKIFGETCIPAGRYQLTMEPSQRFGPDTITVNNVPGYTSIRVHSGSDKNSTLGCIVVGDQINRETATISGGLNHGVLKRLKERIKAALAVEEVWLTINNP